MCEPIYFNTSADQKASDDINVVSGAESLTAAVSSTQRLFERHTLTKELVDKYRYSLGKMHP